MSNVRDFGAVGDGVVDDTDALAHALEQGEGLIELPRGVYRVTRTLEVDLAARGPIAVRGAGGAAKIVMEGEGPAFHLRGSHGGTADPADFRPEVWKRERMPTLADLEIEGRNPRADGVLIEGVMQATLSGLLIRECRTATRVVKRARNLLIDHCHFYHNSGVGVHFDHANLHQAIVSASHISYCRLGGVRLDGGEVRNLQITGNDIEYNNFKSHGAGVDPAEPTADVFINAEDGSIREGTIAGNTIQATYSPGGANIRLLGGPDSAHRVGMWTISGNLIGSQEVNVHLRSVRGVVLAGNYIYSGHRRNILAEHSRNLVIGSNCVGHNPDYGAAELATGVRLIDCEAVNIAGLLIEDALAGRHTVQGAGPLGERRGLLELTRCRHALVTGAQVFDGAPYGCHLEDCAETMLQGCVVLDRRETKLMLAAIRWTGAGAGNIIANCRLGKGLQAALEAGEAIRARDNIEE